MKFCNKCGTKLKGNESYCLTCGVQFSKPEIKRKKEVTILEEQKPQEQNVSSKYKSWIYIFLVIIIFGLIFTSYQYYYFNKEYKLYYEKFKFEESEKQRYINSYNTEKQNKEQEINLRRQSDSQLANAKALIQTKDTELSDFKKTLSDQNNIIGNLNTELTNKDQTIGSQSQQMEVIKNEMWDIFTDINLLETWVSKNSKLDSNILEDIHNLVGNPLSISEHNCVIYANKMGVDMFRLGFTYEDDYKTSNEGSIDRIFDIKTFWQSKQGDCDDFALFMSSWLRSEYEMAKSKCSENNINVKVIQQPGFIEQNMVKCPCSFYSVCGTLSSNLGHCVVGITNSANPYQISDFVKNTILIEPQGGRYLGYANNEFISTRFIFTNDDFITYSKFPLTSIKIAKEKALKLGFN